MNRGRRARLLFVVATLVGACAWSMFCALQYPPRFGVTPEESVDVVMVPSGDPLNSRTIRAAEWIHTGRAQSMLISGCCGVGDGADWLAERAKEQRVPAEKILLEPRASNTYENVRYSHAILKHVGAKRVAIVTSKYHARRIGLLAERLWPSIEVHVDRVQTPRDVTLFAALLEYVKTVRYVALGYLPLSSLFVP